MLTAVITHGPSGVEVVFSEDLFITAEEGENPDYDPANDLNPIAPELKEMAWGYGAFIVLLIAMRLWLYPKVREGMKRRYDSIQSDHETADALTASARADVAEYEARLTTVRAEAQQKVDAARATLEAERNERLAAANGEIAERRAAAAAEVEAAQAAAMGDVEAAVVDVVGAAATRAVTPTGSASPTASATIDADAVRSAVRSAMGAEVSS